MLETHRTRASALVNLVIQDLRNVDGRLWQQPLKVSTLSKMSERWKEVENSRNQLRAQTQVLNE